MYLATLTLNGKTRYEIRQSYLVKAEHKYRFRTIFDLGSDPTRYIEQISDDICFFSGDLEDSIGKMTSLDPTVLLENLLWNFLPEEEQDRLRRFKDRGQAKVTPLSPEDHSAIEREVHMFDRRRLYYLRYGAVDQSRIFRLNSKLYRPLLRQSRDEREYYFMDLEKELKPNEMKTYVFAIFDLQRHFNEAYSATMPEALNQVDISDYFIKELCDLNQSAGFWNENATESFLHTHLVRYLIMFFDYGYGKRSLFDDFLREFMGRHRAFKWPEKKPDIGTEEIMNVFNTDWKTLQKMNRNELTRLYRERAKELHPDTGGDHDRFVSLNSAYAALIIKKK